MKFSEIKELSEAELQKKHRELGDELLHLQSKANRTSRKTSSPQEHKT